MRDASTSPVWCVVVLVVLSGAGPWTMLLPHMLRSWQFWHSMPIPPNVVDPSHATHDPIHRTLLIHIYLYLGANASHRAALRRLYQRHRAPLAQ